MVRAALTSENDVPLVAEPVQDPLARLEASLSEVPRVKETLRRSEVISREDLVMARITSPTVPVGESLDLDPEATDLWERPVEFAHISITQIEISAAQLLNTDSVRLRFYRYRTRREPQDLVADFDGTSQLTGMWYSSFTDRRIEYSGQDKSDEIHITVRNTSGNSAATTFQIIVYGRRFPPKPPSP